MPTHLPGLAWIQVLVWPVAAWGALRIVTGWGYRPLPVRPDRVGAFAGWLVLAGYFSTIAHLAITLLLGMGPGLMMMADSSSQSGGWMWFYGIWILINFGVLGTAVWIGSWLVRRIDWESVGGDTALEPPKPSASGWRYVYLSIAVAASFLWPLSVASQLWALAANGPMTGPQVAAPFLVSLALAAWLASGLVDDVLASALMGSNPPPPAPRLRQVLWVGAVGLLTTGLSTIPNAILAILPYPIGADSPTPTSSLLWQMDLWIDLALIVGLSVLMLRLLPKPLAESGPRHAFRGVRRLVIAVALASTMAWPLDLLRMLIASLDPMRIGSAATHLPAAIAVALVIWLLTWRPKVQP